MNFKSLLSDLPFYTNNYHSKEYPDIFHSSNWEKASFKERMVALQQLEKENAALQGRQSRTIADKDMASEYDSESKLNIITRGYFTSDEPEKLFINRDMVAQNGSFSRDSTGWLCAQNITHEGIHAAQYDVLNNKKVDEEKLSSIHPDLSNKELLNRDSFTYSDDMTDTMYAFRTSEFSARDGAASRIDCLYNQVSQKYGNDDSYERLKNRENEIEDGRLQVANNQFRTKLTRNEMNQYVSGIVDRDYQRTYCQNNDTPTDKEASSETNSNLINNHPPENNLTSQDNSSTQESILMRENIQTQSNTLFDRNNQTEVTSIKKTNDQAPMEKNTPTGENTQPPTQNIAPAEVDIQAQNNQPSDDKQNNLSPEAKNNGDNQSKGEGNDDGYDYYNGYGYF